jgi:hypothetical protein
MNTLANTVVSDQWPVVSSETYRCRHSIHYHAGRDVRAPTIVGTYSGFDDYHSTGAEHISEVADL